MHSTELAAAQAASIVLHDVTKTYRTGDGQPFQALDGVSVEIPAGQVVAIVGASGSGKSTLLHLVGAMDAPTSGSVTVAGQEIGRLKEAELARYRRTVGFVFQRFHLLPGLTVLDNVCAPVIPYRTDFDKQERARLLLDAVGLGDRTRDLPSRLSGGQQQRVAIARALINRPRLLLADEPTGSLDSRTGREVIELLLKVSAEHGTTLLVVTHDLKLAESCGRRIHLSDGRITDDVDETEKGERTGLLPEN